MDITFLTFPTNRLSMNSIAYRILKENLILNKKFNIKQNLNYFQKYTDIFENEYKIFQHKTTDYSTNTIKYLANSPYGKSYLVSRLIPASETYSKIIYDDIKTENVIISMPSIYTLPYIKFLLTKNLKILLGGHFNFSYSFEQIRSFLTEMGSTEKELNNLIIFKGYLGLETDLHEIIINNKDYISYESDYKHSWENLSTLTYETIDEPFQIGSTNCLYVVFYSGCKYGKCAYCVWKNSTYTNFAEFISVEEMCNNIKSMCEKVNTKRIKFYDGDVKYDKKIEQFCKIMRNDGYEILFISSIFNLKSATNIKFYNECSDYLVLGIDTTDDYSLKIMNKMQKYADILDTKNKMILSLRKDIKIVFIVLIDAPMRNKQSIIDNYYKILNIKNDFFKNGFSDIQFNIFFMTNFPDIPLMNNNHYKLGVNEEYQVGNSNLCSILSKQNNLDYTNINKIMKPLLRVDENNNLLKSDFEYLDYNLIKELFI